MCVPPPVHSSRPAGTRSGLEPGLSRVMGIRAIVHRWPRATGFVMAGTGLVFLAGAFGPPWMRGPGILLGIPFLIAAVSLLGRSGQVAAALEPLQGRTVAVTVRGQALPGTFELEGFQALGASLWIRLHQAGGHSFRMKITQPLRLLPGRDAWNITYAGHVHWGASRLPRPAGSRETGMVRLLLAPPGAVTPSRGPGPDRR